MSRQRSGYRLHVLPWLRRPGTLLLRDWLAITVGRDILAWRPLSDRELRHELAHVAQWRRYGWTLSDRELRHELAHVAQWRRYGWTLPARYALAAWQAWRAGRGWYHGNGFELEARAAETAVAASAQDEA